MGTKDDIVLAALDTEEGRIKLADSLRDVIRKRIAERAAEPLCHRVYHPFLCRGPFKSACPVCGFRPS
jgi:hypothetical protein